MEKDAEGEFGFFVAGPVLNSPKDKTQTINSDTENKKNKNHYDYEIFTYKSKAMEYVQKMTLQNKNKAVKYAYVRVADYSAARILQDEGMKASQFHRKKRKIEQDQEQQVQDEKNVKKSKPSLKLNSHSSYQTSIQQSFASDILSISNDLSLNTFPIALISNNNGWMWAYQLNSDSIRIENNQNCSLPFSISNEQHKTFSEIENFYLALLSIYSFVLNVVINRQNSYYHKLSHYNNATPTTIHIKLLTSTNLQHLVSSTSIKSQINLHCHDNKTLVQNLNLIYLRLLVIQNPHFKIVVSPVTEVKLKTLNIMESYLKFITNKRQSPFNHSNIFSNSQVKIVQNFYVTNFIRSFTSKINLDCKNSVQVYPLLINKNSHEDKNVNFSEICLHFDKLRVVSDKIHSKIETKVLKNTFISSLLCIFVNWSKILWGNDYAKFRIVKQDNFKKLFAEFITMTHKDGYQNENIYNIMHAVAKKDSKKNEHLYWKMMDMIQLYQLKQYIILEEQQQMSN